MWRVGSILAPVAARPSRMTERSEASETDVVPPAAALRPLPPVELWHPEVCGDIGLRIDRNGTWLQHDQPIRRFALTRLFSTILRKDPDGYVLVTPSEKIRVAVEDAPFVAVELKRERDELGPILSFRTNVGDWTTADSDHPLRFESGAHGGVKPYVKVRGGLWALVTRSLMMDLLENAEFREQDEIMQCGVVSCGIFFSAGPADESWTSP
jgi:hypothetical protein